MIAPMMRRFFFSLAACSSADSGFGRGFLVAVAEDFPIGDCFRPLGRLLGAPLAGCWVARPAVPRALVREVPCREAVVDVERLVRFGVPSAAVGRGRGLRSLGVLFGLPSRGSVPGIGFVSEGLGRFAPREGVPDRRALPGSPLPGVLPLRGFP